MEFASYLQAALCCVMLVRVAGTSCRVERTNVESGEIASPSMTTLVDEDESCEWIVSAPPGKKLLVNIRNIHLASENHTLTVAMDDSSYNVPRECEKCWTNMVGEVLNVTFIALGTVNVSENELFPSGSGASNETYVSSFFITYRSFDPRKCEAPRPITNGYYLEKNWSKGSKVSYRCVSPYETVGTTEIMCVVLEDSPVPVWDVKPPRCVILSCNNQVLNRTAGKGMIVHPGYPSKTVLANQTCQWNVATDADRCIAVTIKNFGLPLVKAKHKSGRSFLELSEGNGERVLLRLQGQMPTQVLVTSTNQLNIVLQTGDVASKGNDAGGTYGFTIEYEATCKMLWPPQDGSFSANDLSVGSSVGVTCDVGYRLEGESVLHCLTGGTWNASVPRCLPTITTMLSIASTRWTTTVPLIPSKGSKKTDILHEQNAAEKEKLPKEEKPPPPKGDDDETLADLDLGDEDEEVETLYRESSSTDAPVDMLTVALITLGIVLPLLLITASLGAYFWYRKRYPARMGFGRKFETFENPIYHKRGPRGGVGGSADNPAELQRLTTLSSP